MTYIDKINGSPGCKLSAAYEIGLTPVDVKEADGTIEFDSHGEWEKYGEFAIKKCSGIDVNFHAHWDGKKFSCWLISVDDEWMLSGKMGKRLTSNCFTMFSEHCRMMDSYFEKLIPLLTLHSHVGFVTLGVTLNKAVPKYRDIYFGITDAQERCLEHLYNMKSADVFSIIDDKRPSDSLVRGFSGYMRVHTYPYIPEANKNFLDIVDDRPELVWDADSYVITGRGDNIVKLWGSLYLQAEQLRKHDACWRIDGDKKPRQIFYLLKQSHII